MKRIILPFLLFISLASKGQITVTKIEFESLKKIAIISSETSSSKENIDVPVLKFKFIDLESNLLKFYEAQLEENYYISVSKSRWFCSSIQAISIMTVPFKIRARNSDGFVTAQADLKNIGIFFPFYIKEIERYWLDNSKSTHKFSIGFLIAPMVTVLNDNNTQNYFQNSEISYSSIMLSSSMAATYTYNNITFALIPIGFDFGLDTAGKQWVNNGKYWFGFGIGIDTKLFGF